MVQVLVVRGGKMVGEKNYKMKTLDDTDDNETLSSFLKQYYADQIIFPREILLPHPIDESSLISDWLSGKKENRVRLDVPFTRKKEGPRAYGRGKC